MEDGLFFTVSEVVTVVETQHKELMPQPAQPESKESPVAIVYAPRRVTVYRVFENELDALGSTQNSVHLPFFGVAFGVVITLAITLLTVDIADVRTYAAFWACLLASFALTAYFGIRAWFDWRKARQHIRAIKEKNPIREAQLGS